MSSRTTAFDESGSSHRRPRAEPQRWLATSAHAYPSGLFPTLEELLEAVDHHENWKSGKLLKDCEAVPF